MRLLKSCRSVVSHAVVVIVRFVALVAFVVCHVVVVRRKRSASMNTLSPHGRQDSIWYNHPVKHL
jgi:hypothetical protein